MTQDDEFVPKRNKMIPATLRGQEMSMAEELKAARMTFGYLWFETLKLSEEYLRCCRFDGEGRLGLLYKDFGDVKTDFSKWWMKHGRKIFAETKPFNKVKTYQRDDLDRLFYNKDRLVLEVPLTIRKQTVMRQIGMALKKAYAQRDPIDIYRQSSAKRQIIKTKLRKDTVKLLLEITKLRRENPKLSNYELGVKAGIKLDLLARNKDEEWNIELERRRMTIAVSRYLTQAKNLIANAEQGIFPSIKSLP
jgi:hypothetical protein